MSFRKLDLLTLLAFLPCDISYFPKNRGTLPYIRPCAYKRTFWAGNLQMLLRKRCMSWHDL